jgi:hypothetical protein
MHWFVLVYWPEQEVRTGAGFFRYLRAYTWGEARDQMIPARYERFPWTLAPLERDGTYWTGNEFQACRDLPADFVKGERE